MVGRTGSKKRCVRFCKNILYIFFLFLIHLTLNPQSCLSGVSPLGKKLLVLCFLTYLILTPQRCLSGMSPLGKELLVLCFLMYLILKPQGCLSGVSPLGQELLALCFLMYLILKPQSCLSGVSPLGKEHFCYIFCSLVSFEFPMLYRRCVRFWKKVLGMICWCFCFGFVGFQRLE